nr:hypothetical protein CFP56_53950 [Quercus suber]
MPWSIVVLVVAPNNVRLTALPAVPFAVESNVEMLLQCQPGFEIYNQLTKTLDLVGELNRVALDNVRAMASEASTQATSRGGGGGGSRGRGRSGGHGGGPDDDEALEADWDTYMDGAGAEHIFDAQARPRSLLPTPLSPPLFNGSAHEGGCIFVPTLGRLTPPVVQAEPTQEPSLPNPNEPAAQIEQIRSENIEPVHGLRRSLCTDIHPPGCGTSDDVHFEESPVDPTAAVADDGDDEVHVDSVDAKPTIPPPLSLRAMMETFMTTQADHGQLLDGLVAEVAALSAEFTEYRTAFPPPPPSDS